jgi:hypothetical protein
MVRGIAALAPASAMQKLFVLNSANLTLTTDQTMTQVFAGTFYVVQVIGVVWASGAFGTACAGGIYTATAKGGTAIVAAGQSYAALTGSGTAVNDVIAAAGPFNATPIYFSLTTGNTGALTANVSVWGCVLQ